MLSAQGVGDHVDLGVDVFQNGYFVFTHGLVQGDFPCHDATQRASYWKESIKKRYIISIM